MKMKDVSITLRISEQEKEELKRLAGYKDLSVSQVVRQAIKQYLEKEKVQ